MVKIKPRPLLIIFIIIFGLQPLIEYHYRIYVTDKNHPWEKVNLYIKANTKSYEKVLLPFYDIQNPYAILFKSFEYLRSDLAQIYIWTNKFTENTHRKQIQSEVKRRNRPIEIINLQELNYDGFWFITYSSRLNYEITKLISNKYYLVETISMGEVNLYHFAKRDRYVSEKD